MEHLGPWGEVVPNDKPFKKGMNMGLNGKQQHVPIAEQNPDLSVPRFVGRIAVVFSGCMVIKKKQTNMF